MNTPSVDRENPSGLTHWGEREVGGGGGRGEIAEPEGAAFASWQRCASVSR